jgi:DNA-binding protein HU-beta
MTTSELVELLAQKTGSSKSEARKLVDLVLGAIVDTAAKGEEVSLHGFGKFKVKATAARETRNPATGKPMNIAAGRKLSFAAAKQVKDRLNG